MRQNPHPKGWPAGGLATSNDPTVFFGGSNLVLVSPRAPAPRSVHSARIDHPRQCLDLAHQTLQVFPGFIGVFAAHLNAGAKPGWFTITPLTRHMGGECGFECADVTAPRT